MGVEQAEHIQAQHPTRPEPFKSRTKKMQAVRLRRNVAICVQNRQRVKASVPSGIEGIGQGRHLNFHPTCLGLLGHVLAQVHPKHLVRQSRHHADALSPPARSASEVHHPLDLLAMASHVLQLFRHPDVDRGGVSLALLDLRILGIVGRCMLLVIAIHHPLNGLGRGFGHLVARNVGSLCVCLQNERLHLHSSVTILGQFQGRSRGLFIAFHALARLDIVKHKPVQRFQCRVVQMQGHKGVLRASIADFVDGAIRLRDDSSWRGTHDILHHHHPFVQGVIHIFSSP